MMLMTLPPYSADKNIEFVVNNLEHSSSILFKWLNGNYMEVNTGKSHLLVSRNVKVTTKIDRNLKNILNLKKNKCY